MWQNRKVVTLRGNRCPWQPNINVTAVPKYFHYINKGWLCRQGRADSLVLIVLWLWYDFGRQCWCSNHCMINFSTSEWRVFPATVTPSLQGWPGFFFFLFAQVNQNSLKKRKSMLLLLRQTVHPNHSQCKELKKPRNGLLEYTDLIMRNARLFFTMKKGELVPGPRQWSVLSALWNFLNSV